MVVCVYVCLVKDAFQIDPDVQIPDMEKLCTSFRNRINTSLPGANCNKLYHLTNPTKLPACKQLLLTLLETSNGMRTSLEYVSNNLGILKRMYAPEEAVWSKR